MLHHLFDLAIFVQFDREVGLDQQISFVVLSGHHYVWICEERNFCNDKNDRRNSGGTLRQKFNLIDT